MRPTSRLLATLLLSALAGCGAPPADAPVRTRILMIGNSYTGSNSMPVWFRSLVEDLRPDLGPVYVDAYHPSGAVLANHVAQLEMEGRTALERALAPPGATRWEHVVLQEQSMIPGLARDHPSAQAGRRSAAKLAEALAPRTGRILLYQTWGDRERNRQFPEVYPDHPTMARRVAAGTRGYAEAMAATGAPVEVAVAPVGDAFLAAWDQERAAGRDPLAEASPFRALYIADGEHPSPQGSYLAACVLAGALTDEDPARASWRPGAVPAEAAARLRALASRVLRDPARVPSEGPSR